MYANILIAIVLPTWAVEHNKTGLPDLSGVPDGAINDQLCYSNGLSLNLAAVADNLKTEVFIID